MKKQIKTKTTKDIKKKKTTFGDIHNQYNNQVDLINPSKKRQPAPKTTRAKKPNSEYVRRKNLRKNEVYTKLFAFVIFVLFIFYIGGYFVLLMNRETTDSTTVFSGSISQPLVTKGAVIRDETVFKSPVDGNVVYYVGDNEKIKSGTIVAAIQNSDNIDDILSELDDLDKKIYDLQERRDDYSIAQKDAKRIASEIKLGIDNTMFNFSTNDMDAFYKVKDSVDKKINVRNQLLLQENTGSLQSHAEDRKRALENLENNESSLTAPTGGIISYYIDGFEELFNFENLYSLTKDHIRSAAKDRTVVTSKTVKKDDSVFKTINSNTWYIASYIDTGFIADWNEGDIKTISIENNKIYEDLDVIVDRIIENSKESYVVFKITNKLLNYINTREVTLKLSNNDDEGLKVPNSAVTEMLLLKIPKKYIYGSDNNTVKRLFNGEVKEEAIRKYLSDQENVWVVQKYSIIQYGDLIVNPDDSADTFKVEESTTITGVYKINSGIAKFARIYVKEVLDGFTILDPNAAQEVRIYDSIVTDAANIVEGQKVYKKN